MKNCILTSLAVAGLLVSSMASAQWTAGAGYLHISDDFDLGALYGSVGYRMDLGEGLVFQPEVRGGIGIVDDTVDGVDVEIDNLFGFTTRLQYEFIGGGYIFAVPSYTRGKFSASIPLTDGTTISASDSSWEFGIGAGVGYMFNERVGGEVAYENIDGTDIFSAGLRFNF